MATPNLNRLVRISGATTTNRFVPTRRLYDPNRLIPLTDSLTNHGRLRVFDADGGVNDELLTADAIVARTLTGIQVSEYTKDLPEDSVNIDFIDAWYIPQGQLNPGETRRFFILNPNANVHDNYVQFDVLDEPTVQGSPENQIYDVPLANGVLVGDNFDLPRTAFWVIGVSGIGAVEAVSSDPVSQRAWASILERGAEAGLISVGDDTEFGTEETATFVTRYDPTRGIGGTITDDLGRVWAVRGSRTILDRRFLEYTAARNVRFDDG